MKPWHVILIRSAYDGSKMGLNIIRKRFHLTRCLCTSSLTSQTDQRFSVLVRVHPEDPMLAERKSLFESVPCGGVHFWSSGKWIDACKQFAPSGTTHIVQTRMDDDDAFCPTFMERLRRELRRTDKPTWYSFPSGVRVVGGKYSGMTQVGNQYISLQVPVDSNRCVFDVVHGQVGRSGMPAVTVDSDLAWLWYRHRDAKSSGGFRGATAPVGRLRDKFAVDWETLYAQ